MVKLTTDEGISVLRRSRGWLTASALLRASEWRRTAIGHYHHGMDPMNNEVSGKKCSKTFWGQGGGIFAAMAASISRCGISKEQKREGVPLYIKCLAA
ncbi:hypothetical protein KCP75_20355 [Salmonella enterica subsp. enterica]|nr:hypothetical protein KCP75_20355 [Salmonella enterica subsp. enterica]